MKKLMMMVAVALAGFAARADFSNVYLLWNLADASTVSTFSYAQIGYALTSGGETSWLTAEDTALTKFSADGVGIGKAGMFALLPDTIANWSDYSFIVSAYADGGTLLGSSEMVAFGDIVSDGSHFYTDMGTVGEAYGFDVAAVPEPTSGMLLLLGLAGLALRRKRV